MIKHEVICMDCGCLLSSTKETGEKFPHRCWVKAQQEDNTKSTNLENLAAYDQPQE